MHEKTIKKGNKKNKKQKKKPDITDISYFILVSHS